MKKQDIYLYINIAISACIYVLNYFYQSNNMKIRLSKPLKKEWCIDGEKLEDNGDKFNIHIDNDFKVLVPNKNIDELFIDTTIKKF